MGLLKRLCHGLQENLGIGKRGREYHYGANDQVIHREEYEQYRQAIYESYRAPDWYCHGTSRYQHRDRLCAGGPRGILFTGLRLKDMGVILTKGYDKADEEARKKAPPRAYSDEDRRGNAHSQKWEQDVKDAGPASWTDGSYHNPDINSDSRKDGSSHSSNGAREPRGKQGHLYRRGEIDYDDGRPGARGPGQHCTRNHVPMVVSFVAAKTLATTRVRMLEDLVHNLGLEADEIMTDMTMLAVQWITTTSSATNIRLLECLLHTLGVGAGRKMREVETVAGIETTHGTTSVAAATG
ncbi:hypothetical protein B0A49_07403 [Cryomyces minteri]|uniref:Uncharacterized protein n=1 Tax=Cryomyces minteri TaxID=331657 RepID=A0A4U0WQ02_9PEZI|nr:hypothetical protein B0A49_07403 [Cryomyces minteri]